MNFDRSSWNLFLENVTWKTWYLLNFLSHQFHFEIVLKRNPVQGFPGISNVYSSELTDAIYSQNIFVNNRSNCLHTIWSSMKEISQIICCPQAGIIKCPKKPSSIWPLGNSNFCTFWNQWTLIESVQNCREKTCLN